MGCNCSGVLFSSMEVASHRLRERVAQPAGYIPVQPYATTKSAEVSASPSASVVNCANVLGTGHGLILIDCDVGELHASAVSVVKKLNRFSMGCKCVAVHFSCMDAASHRLRERVAQSRRETRQRRIARLCRGGRSCGCAAAMQFRLPSAAARSGRGKRCRARHISPVRGNLRRCFGLKVAAGFRFSVNVSRLRSREVSTVSPARYHFCAKIVAFTRTARNSKLHIRILYFASGPL